MLSNVLMATVSKDIGIYNNFTILVHASQGLFIFHTFKAGYHRNWFRPMSYILKTLYDTRCGTRYNRMAWQWAETLMEIRGTLADIRGTTK